MVESYANELDDIFQPLTSTVFAKKHSLKRSEALRLLESYFASREDDKSLWGLYAVCGVSKVVEAPYLASSSSGGIDLVKHVIVPKEDIEQTKKSFDSVFNCSLHSIQRTSRDETHVCGTHWDNADDLQGVTVPHPQSKVKKVEATEAATSKETANVEAPSKADKKSNPIKNMFSNVPKKKNTIDDDVKIEVDEDEKELKKSPIKTEEPPREKKKKPSGEPKKRKTPTPEPEKKMDGRKRPKIDVDNDDLFDADYSEPEREVEPEAEPEPEPKRKKAKARDGNENKKTQPLFSKMAEEKAEGSEKTEVEETKRRATKMEKIVETYIDEDGFLVSKEVNKNVEVTDENKPQEKAKPKVVAPAGPAKAGPKKNSTITSFFKKV